MKALRCAVRVRDTFLLELGRARAERAAEEYLKVQGARLLAEREAAEEVSEPSLTVGAATGALRADLGRAIRAMPLTSASPVAEDRPASTPSPVVGVGHLTSAQETAEGTPGGGEIASTPCSDPAAGQPNYNDLPSPDDLRMAAMGIGGRLDGDWRPLGERLRNLADLWEGVRATPN